MCVLTVILFSFVLCFDLTQTNVDSQETMFDCYKQPRGVFFLCFKLDVIQTFISCPYLFSIVAVAMIYVDRDIFEWYVAIAARC